MFTVTAIAPGDLGLREKHERAQDAYLAAQTWIAGATRMSLLWPTTAGGIHGPDEIRGFMEAMQKLNTNA